MRSLSRWSQYGVILAALAFATPTDAARRPAAPAPGDAAQPPAEAAAPEPARQAPALTEEFRMAAVQLDAATRGWLGKNGAGRSDSYVYAMDGAPLMLYSAPRH